MKEENGSFIRIHKKVYDGQPFGTVSEGFIGSEDELNEEFFVESEESWERNSTISEKSGGENSYEGKTGICSQECGG